MNKIISANINGFVFSIDELAYAKLKAYLETIKQKVDNVEVAQDIENRIAELFSQKLGDGKTAIFDADVDEVMEQIGKPEEFGQEEQADAGANTRTHDAAAAGRKRLYRDPDDKVIGGVCSGIAAYFGLDPVVVRLAFAAAFFLFGTGFVLYILLMVILPKALTPAEKLEMRGEPVDYKNVSRAVEKDFREVYQRYKPEVKTGFQRLLDILVKVGMVLLVIFVLSIVIPGGFGVLSAIGVAAWSLPTLSSYMFATQSEALIILTGLMLFVLMPLIGIVWTVLRFAFRLKPLGRIYSILMSVLWFTGFCMLAYSTYHTGMQFSQNAAVTDYDTLEVPSSSRPVLILRANSSIARTAFVFRDEDGAETFSHIRNNEDFKEALDREISERVELNIAAGYADKPVLKHVRLSNGAGRAEAQRNAESIAYNYELKDSVLTINDYFSMGNQQLWRNQKVRLKLELPPAYRVYIDESCESVLDMDRRDEDDITGRFLRVDSKGIIRE